LLLLLLPPPPFPQVTIEKTITATTAIIPNILIVIFIENSSLKNVYKKANRLSGWHFSKY
jgi:hypothetical protein